MAIRNDISINWSTSPRIIEVAAPSVELTVQDLYDTIRYLAMQPEAMDDLEIIDGSGKEELGERFLVALTTKLFNAKVKFENRPVLTTCNITGGNLVAIDENGFNMSPIEPSLNVTVAYAKATSALIVQVEGSPLTEEEHNHLMQSVALQSTLSQVSIRSSSIKEIIEKIRKQVDTTFKIETGGWKITKNQCIVYAPDNKTEIIRFNLFDKSGKPTELNPSQMKRV